MACKFYGVNHVFLFEKSCIFLGCSTKCIKSAALHIIIELERRDDYLYIHDV